MVPVAHSNQSLTLIFITALENGILRHWLWLVAIGNKATKKKLGFVRFSRTLMLMAYA